MSNNRQYAFPRKRGKIGKKLPQSEANILYEWIDYDGDVHRTVDPPNPCETRLPVRKIDVSTTDQDVVIPYGYHWEVVHNESGDVVNSGFTRTDPPPSGPLKDPKGFTMRVTSVRRID